LIKKADVLALTKAFLLYTKLPRHKRWQLQSSNALAASNEMQRDDRAGWAFKFHTLLDLNCSRPEHQQQPASGFAGPGPVPLRRVHSLSEKGALTGRPGRCMAAHLTSPACPPNFSNLPPGLLQPAHEHESSAPVHQPNALPPGRCATTASSSTLRSSCRRWPS